MALGVEHFWLFNHDDNPAVSNRLLKPYIESQRVEMISIAGHDKLCKIPRSDIQTYVFKEAVRQASGKTYWLALIDLDEFLLPRRENDLRTVLWDYEEFSSLIVNWQIFGTNGFIKCPPTQINHLLRRAETQYWFNRYVKSIVRPENIDLDVIIPSAGVSLPHMFVPHTGYAVNERFEPVSEIGFRQDFHGDTLVINHYALRSFQDFWEVKVPRSHFYGLPLCTQEYWDNYDRNEIFDDEISRRFGQFVL